LAVAQQQAAHGLTPREQLICLGKPPPTATPAPTPTFGPTPTPAPTPTLSAEDHINQGRKYAEAGQYDLAMDEFTEAIALTTDDASIYTEACFIGTMNDMAKMVLPICDRAVEIAANEATAHFTRGIAYLESGDDKQAIISFNRAIELDSTFALAYGMRAATQIKQITETSDPEQDIGSLEQAIRDLEMYLMLEPNAPDKDDVEKIIGAMKSLVEKLKK
jgi:tetratricopeptide (TPR) repeat protein